jgi:hypothetical protein
MICEAQVNWLSMGVVWSPAAQCQCSPRRERRAESISVAMTGTLVGSVEGPWEPRTQVRVLLRDERRAVVREYYPSLSRTGQAGARFEMRGLPPDNYTLEVWAPGFCQERLDGVRIEPSCVTDAGTVRLVRASQPRVPALLRRWGSPLSSAPPPARWSRRRQFRAVEGEGPSAPARSRERPGWALGSA